MFASNSIKKTIIIAIFITACLSLGIYVYHTQIPKDSIYEFNPTTDNATVLDIFNKNYSWLFASDDSSPTFMLKYRTFDNNPMHFGALKIKVLRDNNTIAGFTAYYMESHQEGRILFVAVDHAFRGKGYGSLLTQHAMEQLFRMGANHISLWTRTDNLPAQKIYTALGFKEAFEENGFIFFEYWPS